MRFRASKTGLSAQIPNNFYSDHSNAVLLLQFFFVRASVMSYWRLFCHCFFFISPTFDAFKVWKAVLRDYRISWITSIIVFKKNRRIIFSLRFDHEVFSTAILSRPLIQKGQLSVSGERMCTRSG